MLHSLVSVQFDSRTPICHLSTTKAPKCRYSTRRFVLHAWPKESGRCNRFGKVTFPTPRVLLATPTGLRLQVGPQLYANAGALYNTRNGNNPAQAILNAGVAVSMAAVYRFHIRRQHFLMRNQLDVPLIGMKFSPNYGQSYYEIFSEGNSDPNLCATTPFNAPCLRNLLTIDIPFKRSTLRAGYLIDIRQSHLHELKYHNYTHAFMLGWVRHISYKKSQRQTPEGFIM